MALSDVIASITSGSGNTLYVVAVIVFIGGAALLLAVGGGVMLWMRKRWTLKVEIKLPRSDGKIISSEWGKGYYNAKRGVVFIKRPGLRGSTYPIKIFDVRKYLQGTDTFTVIQLAPDEYRPVLMESYLTHDRKYIDKDTGKVTIMKEAIINIQVDHGKNKAWKTAFQEASKQAYSLSSFFQQFQTPIAIAIVLVSVFTGFSILWTKIG